MVPLTVFSFWEKLMRKVKKQLNENNAGFKNCQDWFVLTKLGIAFFRIRKDLLIVIFIRF